MTKKIIIKSNQLKSRSGKKIASQCAISVPKKRLKRAVTKNIKKYKGVLKILATR